MAQSIASEAGAPDLNGSMRERIIRKIKRCLALGKSSNPNEADMAMRQAQTMMRVYRLTEADIHAESVDCETRDTGLIRMADWQRGLANTAAQAFGCKLLMSHRTGGRWVAHCHPLFDTKPIDAKSPEEAQAEVMRLARKWVSEAAAALN